MNQTNHDLPQKMNIRCNAIIGNQCDTNSVETFEWEGRHIPLSLYAAQYRIGERSIRYSELFPEIYQALLDAKKE